VDKRVSEESLSLRDQGLEMDDNATGTMKHNKTATRALSFPICLSFLLIVGCNVKLPGKPNPTDRPVPVEKVLAFDELYSRNCAGCHGKNGTHGPAPPLNDPLFRAIVPKEMLEALLKEGRKQGQIKTAMAPFAHESGGPLSSAQVKVLVHEIKGLRYRIVETDINSKQTVDVEANEQGIVPQWGLVAAVPSSTPPYAVTKTAGDAKLGAPIFLRACANCHGIDGGGVVRDGKLCNKINDPTFLSLISDQELRRIIITGRGDLKMPDYSQKNGRDENFQPLTSAQIGDLGALLSEWRNGKTK
jgi:cytochrome c oxidase cbb3-type subunit III